MLKKSIFTFKMVKKKSKFQVHNIVLNSLAQKLSEL